MEVLAAAAILSSLGLPVIFLLAQNLRTLGVDRVRLVAEQLARSTVERFGLDREPIQRLLTPSEKDPTLLHAIDPWTRSPADYDDLAGTPLAPLVASHKLSMKLELIRDLVQGTDLLVCEVSWHPDGNSRRARTRVTHLRGVVHDHLHSF